MKGPSYPASSSVACFVGSGRGGEGYCSALFCGGGGCGHGPCWRCSLWRPLGSRRYPCLCRWRPRVPYPARQEQVRPRQALQDVTRDVAGCGYLADIARGAQATQCSQAPTATETQPSPSDAEDSQRSVRTVLANPPSSPSAAASSSAFLTPAPSRASSPLPTPRELFPEEDSNPAPPRQESGEAPARAGGARAEEGPAVANESPGAGAAPTGEEAEATPDLAALPPCARCMGQMAPRRRRKKSQCCQVCSRIMECRELGAHCNACGEHACLQCPSATAASAGGVASNAGVASEVSGEARSVDSTR